MTNDVIIPIGAKAIPLTRDKFAIVDEADYGWLNQWKWCYAYGGYVGRSQYLGGGRENAVTKTILMHRLIMNAPLFLHVDHVNRNTLDNRRENMRLVTNSQNMMNRIANVNFASSQYKGVSWHKTKQKWGVVIVKDKIRYNLGHFDDESKAALAYNAAAIKLFGPYARLNRVA
jgi:hypothetical protein